MANKTGLALPEPHELPSGTWTRLAATTMDLAAHLDQTRRSLAGGNPALNVLLGQLESQAMTRMQEVLECGFGSDSPSSWRQGSSSYGAGAGDQPDPWSPTGETPSPKHDKQPGESTRSRGRLSARWKRRRDDTEGTELPVVVEGSVDEVTEEQQDGTT